ncbi:sulfate transporter family-domain-containing protein [Fennellomyces sp. T-0311]|nr:sulfate transporter family-domain-containing protein [Fennellomyces sp. T-0311]
MATNQSTGISTSHSHASLTDYADDTSSLSSRDSTDVLVRNVAATSSLDETRLLLPTGHHNIPRYMTASPIPSAQLILDHTPKDTWSLIKMRSKYYLPILKWLPHYNASLFLGDLIAGLTLSCLLVPQGLSYATALCKLDAIHGLYAIAFPAVTYGIFGMSRQMSVGPEATLSLLVGSSIAQQELHDDDHIDRLAWACLMTLFVGIFTFLLGIVRLGFLDSLMSRALLRGFITGVAVVVMLQQSIILLGLVKLSEEAGITEASTSIERISFLFHNIQKTHVLSAAVSGVAVAVLLGARVIKSKLQQYRLLALFPEVLLVVVLATVLTWFFDWKIDILGEIESAGVPLPSIPVFPDNKHLKDLLVTSAMISVIGFVESVVIAKTYSSRHNYSVSANRELVALGVANIVGGLFQGIPAFGSVARSKINDRAGARTQMACMITGVLALVAIFFLLPSFYYLPKTVLSAIIFVAVLSLLGELPEDLHFIFKIGAWRDLGLLLITFLGTVVISLEFGTLVAITLSLLLTIKETSYPRISIMGRVKGTHNEFRAIHDDPDEIEHLESVLVVRVEEPLFFANTGQLKDRLRRLENYGDMSTHPSERPRRNASSYIIFDVDNMPDIDASAVQIMYEIVESYHAQHVAVYFVHLRERPMDMFRRSGLLDLIGKDHMFQEVSQAIQVIENDMAKLGIEILQ